MYVKPYQIILVLLLFSYNLTKANLSLDSLNNIAKSFLCADIEKSDSISNIVIEISRQTSNYSAEGYALKHKSTNQFCLNKFEIAVSLLKASIVAFEKGDNLEGKTRSLNNLTATYKSLHYLDSALVNSKIQIESALRLGDTIILASSYQTLSSIFFEQIRNDSAMFYNNKALKLAEAANINALKGTCYLDIANINSRINEYDEAIKYYKKAIPLLEESGDIRNLISARNNLSGSYSETGNYEDAILICKENIEVFSQYPYFLASFYHSLAHNYFNIGDFNKSIENNIKGLEYAKETNNILMTGTILSNLSSAYYETKQYGKAIVTGEEAVEYSEKHDIKENLAFAYIHTANAYRGNGNYKNATEYFEKGYELKAVNQSKEQAEMVSELRIEYEVERKELETKNALQSKQLTEQKLKQNRRIFSILILAVILGLLALASYLYGYKNRQKAKLAIQNLKHAKQQLNLERQYRTAELKALKAQMNPHFLFNAFNSLQSYIIENEKRLAIGYLGKFADLMRTYLNHSKETSITLKEEIEANQLYLGLEKVRFNNTLNYSINVDSKLNVEQIQIPPMLLQPFIENALKHGLKHKPTDRQLDLFFKKDGNHLICSIQDNGIGRVASQEINARSNPSHISFATDATNERIDLLNDTLDEKIKIEIEDLNDNKNKATGTKVTLVIPL